MDTTNATRDHLAKLATVNDGAFMGIVITMKKGRVHSAIHVPEGLNPENGRKLLKHLVDALKAFPETIKS